MYNPRKDFEKYVNKILGPLFKSNGFKRYKTRNYVRITKDNIVQSFNFQKADGFAFYINLNSMPLSAEINPYFVEAGLRIQNIHSNFVNTDKAGRFEFGTEYILNKSLEEIRLFLESKLFVWFDINGISKSCIDFEKYVKDNEPKHNHHLIGKLPFIYLLLQEKNYSDAHTFATQLLKYIVSENKPYLNKSKDEVKLLKKMAQLEDESEISNLLLIRSEQTKSDLGITKFKLFEVKYTNLEEYLNREFRNKETLKLSKNGGVEHYHQILNANTEMFYKLKELLCSFPNFIEHNDRRVEIKQNEKASFHFVLNNYDFVLEDNNDIFNWFETNKGIILSDVGGNSQRIELWCDFTIQSENNTYQLRDDILQILRDKLSDKIFIPGRFKFYEK